MIVRRIVDGVSAGFSNRTVLFLSAAGAIQFAAWAPYWLEWPILFNQSFGVGVWIIGWIYCASRIGRMIGAEVVSRMSGRRDVAAGTRQRADRGREHAARAAGAFKASRHRADVSVRHEHLHRRGRAAVQSWFNEQIESSQRATMLSFSSTFATLGRVDRTVRNGFIADRAGLRRRGSLPARSRCSRFRATWRCAARIEASALGEGVAK